ncbi:heterokaryon incompatibility protein-domain-containing protein [Xylariomycetidae sp. FL2044]|nr:heterokaryon incompatibility protein-domain-containing protein [Xylariomycetidae sp. FL2044]
MRLLNVHTLKLVEFGADIPPYAILSHTWEEEEVLYQDILGPDAREKKGFAKVLGCCRQAIADNYEWVWIDTCCIDKSSSSELTEAINSMFIWYRRSEVCYVYLQDVAAIRQGEIAPATMSDGHLSTSHSAHEKESLSRVVEDLLGQSNDHMTFAEWVERPPSRFSWEDVERVKKAAEGEPQFLKQLWASRWFTRGWTLQEFLAPSHVEFFNCNWVYLGTKSSLETLLSYITGIECPTINADGLASISAAQKMSWAATRRTTKEEDIAYCLMGLFNVNMPLLYGEGHRAFQRLQEHIIQQSEDYTLLVWTKTNTDPGGFLAPGPEAFAQHSFLKHCSHSDGAPGDRRKWRGLPESLDYTRLRCWQSHRDQKITTLMEIPEPTQIYIHKPDVPFTMTGRGLHIRLLIYLKIYRYNSRVFPPEEIVEEDALYWTNCLYEGTGDDHPLYIFAPFREMPLNRAISQRAEDQLLYLTTSEMFAQRQLFRWDMVYAEAWTKTAEPVHLRSIFSRGVRDWHFSAAIAQPAGSSVTTSRIMIGWQYRRAVPEHSPWDKNSSNNQFPTPPDIIVPVAPTEDIVVPSDNTDKSIGPVAAFGFVLPNISPDDVYVVLVGSVGIEDYWEEGPQKMWCFYAGKLKQPVEMDVLETLFTDCQFITPHDFNVHRYLSYDRMMIEVSPDELLVLSLGARARKEYDSICLSACLIEREFDPEQPRRQEVVERKLPFQQVEQDDRLGTGRGDEIGDGIDVKGVLYWLLGLISCLIITKWLGIWAELFCAFPDLRECPTWR